MKIINPKSSEEFRKYYNLRYEVLRRPWNQPLGSEKDESEAMSIHRMIINEETGNALAVGRLQFNSKDEAKDFIEKIGEDPEEIMIVPEKEAT